MKAYVINAYGGADVAELTEFAVPELRPHDLRIQVVGVGLNPVDYKTREGMLKMIYSPALPIVLGNELSGEVIEIGGVMIPSASRAAPPSIAGSTSHFFCRLTRA